MKYAKRIVVLILCTVMCLCFVGCGKTKEEEFIKKVSEYTKNCSEEGFVDLFGKEYEMEKDSDGYITYEWDDTSIFEIWGAQVIVAFDKKGEYSCFSAFVYLEEEDSKKIIDAMKKVIGKNYTKRVEEDGIYYYWEDQDDIDWIAVQLDDRGFGISCECFDVSVEDITDTTDISEDSNKWEYLFESENIEDNTISIAEGSWKQAYNEILDLWAAYYDDEYGMWNYCLYDIDEDGVPEMFVKIGTCEADAEINAYTVDNYGDAYWLGTIWASHSGLCGLVTKGEMLRHNASMGVEIITKVYIENNKLMETEIFSAEVDEYHEFKYLTTYRLSDPSGLEWTSNPKENNQAVLDNYMGNYD